ncbi:HNH endonuclease signature motif containing protein [Sphingobium olei]|uniref:HNH endonuclease signature motif containing protein n=1 Tax=Sphingobium olei TaxID=420955 RepID=A0ABW3P068_9SPHN
MALAELIERWDSGDFGDVVRRIASRVEIDESGCWNCSYGRDTSGYPQVSYLSRMELTHRVMYVAAKGIIPSALQLDHLCRNRACCNPDHLEAVPSRENTMRGDTIIARNAAVTHCPKGHEYGPNNAFPADLKRGKQRRCRTCHLEKSKQRKIAERNAA